VVAVLDWELSTLGSPLADLAYNCMPYRLAPSTLGGVLGANLAELGLPSEADYVATYCRRTGRSAFPTGSSTWPSRCSGWPPLPRGSWAA